MKSISFLALAAISMIMPSCINRSEAEDTTEVLELSGNESSRRLRPEHAAAPEQGSDLWVFELRGAVKEVKEVTYYNVGFREGEPYPVDSTATTAHERRYYFDQTGRYVVSQHEVVQRDDCGRIVYWRDNTPNNPGTHPGVLRDTLRYTYGPSGNVLVTSGMGDLAITVYDDEGVIVGQTQRTKEVNARASAFNIIRRLDERGNWVERLTVWVTQGASGNPGSHYSLDKREIEYY